MPRPDAGGNRMGRVEGTEKSRGQVRPIRLEASCRPKTRVSCRGLEGTEDRRWNGSSVRPPGSVRTDHVLRIRVLDSWNTGLSSGRPNPGAFDHDAGGSHISRVRPTAFAPTPRSLSCADDRRYGRPYRAASGREASWTMDQEHGRRRAGDLRRSRPSGAPDGAFAARGLAYRRDRNARR